MLIIGAISVIIMMATSGGALMHTSENHAIHSCISPIYCMLLLIGSDLILVRPSVTSICLTGKLPADPSEKVESALIRGQSPEALKSATLCPAALSLPASLSLCQDLVISGEISLLPVGPPAKVLLIAVLQAIVQAKLWPPSQLLLRL